MLFLWGDFEVGHSGSHYLLGQSQVSFSGVKLQDKITARVRNLFLSPCALQAPILIFLLSSGWSFWPRGEWVEQRISQNTCWDQVESLIQNICWDQLDAKVTVQPMKNSNGSTSPRQWPWHLPSAYPYPHIRSDFWQSNSTSSKGKTLHLSPLSDAAFIPCPFLHILLLHPPSLLTSQKAEPAHSRWSHDNREGVPWARPLSQTSKGRVQPHSDLSGQTGGAACWGNPAGLKWIETGLRGAESMRARQT